jgi:signal transduction histidine kinase
MKHPFDGALILSVDDNDASRYGVARTLRQVGFEVRDAATGYEGLRRAHTDAPDLILLDVKLPDIDGFEVCRQLKADPVTASIPVLQMTATYGSTENWAAALDAGADAYLTQPAEPIVLVATIRALLRAREAERALREANRLKDDFLATLSHELRTPLNAIVGWAHVLRTPNLDPGIVARAIESIQRNAEAQTRLVADILDVSRIVTGKLRIDSRRIDLASAAAAALETVRPSTVSRQITVEYSAAPDVIVHGDASRLQQIVWNLLANAVKFTPTGGNIRLEVRRNVSNVELVVMDTGMGIDPAFLPHVFDRFRQADASMTRSFGGLGLGLALVRDLVQMHGGTVRAESLGKDQGSCFTVVLPAALPLELPAVASASAEDLAAADPAVDPFRSSGPAVVAGIRVLVVDDDEDFLESLDVALRTRGAVVKTATSVQAALAALESWPPDVLISDLGMPDEDGYSLIRAVRARGSSVPAIALTAYAADHDRERSLAAGYQRHVGKPADPIAIIQAVVDLAPPPPARF